MSPTAGDFGQGSAPAERFTCGGCVGLAHVRGLPDDTPAADCPRCGDPTRAFVGQLIEGRPVVVSADEYRRIEDVGVPVDGKPGVRMYCGREFYSAAWL